MSNRTIKPLQLLSDQAIAESADSRDDALEFSTYASVMARVVKGTRGPFTIGIFGEWGMGKTSLMRLVERESKSSDTGTEVISVWFNAWMFERVDYPIIPLVKSVIEALKSHESIVDKSGNSIKALIDALESVICAFKAKGALLTPGASAEVEFDFGKAIENFKKRRKNRHNIPENGDSYEQIFDALHKISEKIVPENVTILVLVDDLDRCFPENAVRLLESIKLILSQAGFIFIIGASRLVIEEYLQSKYEKQYGIQHFNGRAYLDKMIQLTFHIPPHASRIDSFTKQIIATLEDKNTRNELRPISSIIGETCQHNPRSIIRFINRLITDSAIYKARNENVVRATLPVGVFAVTRSLEQTWRDVYGLLVSGDNEEDREYCTIVSRWNDEDLAMWSAYDPLQSSMARPSDMDAVIRNLSMAEPGALKQIATYIINDRTLKSLLQQRIGVEWLTNHALREASVSFVITQSVDDKTAGEAEMLHVSGSILPHTMPEALKRDDVVYADAVRVVIDLKKASTSLLQRKLRIGYGRAARIIEDMEAKGIVAAADGARPRQVLVNDVEEALLR